MQSKFTQKNLGYFCTRVIAIALIFSAAPQFSFSQQSPTKAKFVSPTEKAQQRVKNLSVQKVNPKSDNDAGLPNRAITQLRENPQAICTSWTVSITGADPTTGLRMFRDGIVKTCAAPGGPCQAGIAGSFRYQIFQWTNPVAQCVTVTYTATNASFGFVSVYNAPPTLTNLCANWVTDPGSSGTSGVPIVFSFNGTAGTTYYFLVTNVGAPPSNCTIQIDAPVCNATPCAGTPNPGATTGPNAVCPTVPFTVGITTPQNFAGITYQWQRSTTGVAGSYVDIAGATSSTYTTSITVPTWYQCNVRCTNSGITTTSSPAKAVAINPPSACYCAGGATDVVDEKISRVRYNTIDNSSTSTAGYEDFTAISTTVIQGSTQDITVNISNFFTGDLVKVWIDFNQNGSWTDPGEMVVNTTNTTANPAIAPIFIPLTSSIGPTRMRVRMYWQPADANPGPCGNTAYGQVEDYTVNIQPCIQGVFNTHPANQNIQCGGNAVFSTTTTGSLLTYSWEYRINASSPWLNVPAAPPYSGTTTNTLTITNVPVTMNGYQYRAVIVGPCTAVDFSNVATLTVTPVIPLVTVTPSSPICTGTIVQLSLTNILAPVSTNLFSEDFATVSPLPAGWASQQRSNPLGPTAWFQGNPAVFPSQNGAPAAYIAANYDNTGAVGTISNWLFTPNVTTIKNGDVFTFYTRKVAPDAFADRMQVRMSLNGASTNVGATETSVGDFTTLLLDINPTLVLGVYPTVWTQYTITISGVPTPTSGRLAFRYFVTNGGSAAPNADYIGIDNVVYTSITGGVAAGTWTASPAAPNTMFTNAAATVAYTGTPANTIWVKPAVNTSYSVSFTTPTPCTSATTVVPINVTDPATIAASGQPVNRTACVGTNTSFSVVAGGGPLTYQWQVSVDNGLTWTNISGATGSTLNITNVVQTMNNYLYRVNVTAAPCGTVTSAVARLNTFLLPTVTISATTLQLVPGRSSTITGTSSPAPQSTTSWSWTLNGNPVVPPVTGNSLTVNVDQQGSYRATVTDINGCVNSSNIITIGSEVSDNLWIYPNPNRGQFQVRLYYSGEQAERRSVRIYNAIGQLMAQKEFDLDSNTPHYQSMTFDLPLLSAGTYAVKVVDKYGNKITSGLVAIQ